MNIEISRKRDLESILEWLSKKVFATSGEAIIGAWQIPLLVVSGAALLKPAEYVPVKEIIIQDRIFEIGMLVDNKFAELVKYLTTTQIFREFDGLEIVSHQANKQFVDEYLNQPA